MATWKISSEIEPNYAGGLMRAKWLIGGVRTVKTLAQRNAIPALYRYFSAEESTIVFVEDESQLYRLNNNPSGVTTNADWTLISFGNVSSTLTPIGTWNINNTTPVLSDAGASGLNGNFYFVTGAPTPVEVTISGLFEGEPVTLVDGNMIISVGTRWVVVANSTAWNSIDKPQSIIDYVAGTVIAHTHTVADISDLGSYLTNYLTRSDVADPDIDFEAVPDSDIISSEFIKKYYYRKTEVDNALSSFAQSFLELTDTPSSYSGFASKLVQVNAAGTALEFVDPPATDLTSVLAEGNDAGGVEIINLGLGTQPTSALRRTDILDVSGIFKTSLMPASVMERVYVYAGVETLPENAGLTTTQVQNGDVVKMNSTGVMYVVVDDTQLNLALGYTVFNAGIAASVPWGGITDKPTTLAGYGITDPIIVSSGSYADPTWITSLAWNKITGTPTTLAGYGIVDGWKTSGTTTLTAPTTIAAGAHTLVMGHNPIVTDITSNYNFLFGYDHSLSGVAGGLIQWSIVFGEAGSIVNNKSGSTVNNAVIMGGYLNSITIATTATGVNQYSSIYNPIIVGARNEITNANSTGPLTAPMAIGYKQLIEGDQSLGMGYYGRTTTAGLGAFVHGFVTTYSQFGNHTGTVERVTVGGKHAVNISANSESQTVGHGAYADYSVILGGQDHHIPSDSPGTVILGGNAIKARATDPDNVYVPYLNITQITQDDALTQVLVRNADTGKLYYRIGSTLGVSGLTINRIPYASSATSLSDSADLTWNPTNKQLIVSTHRWWGINENLFIGNGSGIATVTGNNNTGYGSLTLASLTSGNQNIGIGSMAARAVTSGNSNIMLGYLTGDAITTGNDNIGIGTGAISALTTNSNNVAIGGGTLGSVTGGKNVAIGYTAGGSLTNGWANVLIGEAAGGNLTTAQSVVCIGFAIHAVSPTANGQLSIQNAIFGLNNTGSTTTVSSGTIGMYVNDPTASLDILGSTIDKASLRLRTGVAPTTPNDGDMWQDGTNLYIRINGVTKTVTLT